MGNKGKKTNKKKKGGKKGGSLVVNNADREEELLEELRTRTRSLLASMKGVAPDGAPFAARGKRHPLALLFESISELVEKLILEQRGRLEKAQLSDETQIDGREQRRQTEILSGASDRNGDQLWEKFSEWLSLCKIEPKERGFPVELRKTPNGQAGFGLFATRDIGYGETILEIPEGCMLCPYFDHCLVKDASSPPPPFDPARPREEDQSMKPLCLVMHIVNERWKGSRSVAGPYLDTMPTSYSTPLYWALESILELKNTAHLKRAVSLQMLTLWEYLQMRDMIKQVHTKAAEKADGGKMDLIPLEQFSYESFRWATATAHTRQNLIPYFASDDSESDAALKAENVQNAFGLIPMWDMINHDDSDKACTSDISVIDPTGSNGGAHGGTSQRRGVLVCRTPPMPPHSTGTETNGEGDDPCFQKGEEVKMYYGDRSSAQLLFHSGFVNGGKNAEGNLNRKDHTVIRIALPNAESEAGLDRVREMIAARFGFRAYGEQGVDHDGISLAGTAATIIGGRHETNRSKREVIITDVSVSPHVACSDELKRALLLCLADKDELAYLLRNVDRYMAPQTKKEAAPVGGPAEESDKLLDLSDKHLQLISQIIEARTEKRYKVGTPCPEFSLTENNIWLDEKCAKVLSDDLSYCDYITLESWFGKFNALF